MAKKKRGHGSGHGGGRGRQPQRRHTPSRPTVSGPEVGPDDGAEDQMLFQALRRTLRSDGPLDLLATVSGFLELTAPRSRDPFAKDAPHVELADLVESLIGTPYAETTAALTAMRAMIADEVMATRMGRELETRRHFLPEWVTGLERATIDPDVWFLTHVLGDGDDYLMGVTLPSGHAITALVYVDHNLGGVVKDAFVVPEQLEDVALRMGTLIDEDQTLTRTDAATARAVMEDAITHGARLYPPCETETWPMCRPIVEWMLRKLPPGGEAPEWREWTEEETAAVIDDFFASPYGKPLDHPDERGLLETLMWFGTGYANANPFLWSPVTVEMLLDDWFPRKIVAEPAYLAKMPNLLRAFIRYAHQREGIRDELTEETLSAVDDWEPDYQRAIRSERLQGPEALIAGMMDERDDELAEFGFPGVGPDGSFDIAAFMLTDLEQKVGGRTRLQNLSLDPLPDEPFEWAGVPDDIRPVVQEIVDICDRCAEELFDVEHRTAMRRFLSRAAVGDPKVFRRKASPVRGAAAVAWIICRANDSAGVTSSGMQSQELLAWFGVKGVSDRANTLMRACGIDPHGPYPWLNLGAADLLTSAKRSGIAEARDRWMSE